MAGLVNALVQRQAVARPRSTSLSRATGSSDDGGWLQRNIIKPLQGIGDAAGPITGQQGSGNSVSGNRTNGGSAAPGSVNSFNTGQPGSTWSTQTYQRNNLDQFAPQLGMLGSNLGLSQAELQNQRNVLLGNLTARNQAFDAQQAAYRNATNTDLKLANLDIQGFDIQQGNFPQWYKFLAEQWGNRMNMGKSELDFIAEQQVNSANQRLIDWKEIQQGRKVVGEQATRGRRDATSSATVSGVIQNAQQDYNDIEQERVNALTDLDFVDEKSRLSETQRRQELSNRRAQLIGDLTGFDISTREQQAKLREREQLLGIEAQKARLKPQQLMDQLNVTMANLGLDRVMSTGQFLEAMSGLSAQDRALLNQYNLDVGNTLGQVTTWSSNVPPASRGSRPANPGRQTWNQQGFR